MACAMVDRRAPEARGECHAQHEPGGAPQALLLEAFRVDCAEPGSPQQAAAQESLRLLRAALEGLDVGEGAASSATQGLLEALLAADVPGWLLAHLGALGFEARKDAMRLFRAVVRLAGPLGMERQLVEYVRGHPRVLHQLLEGCRRPEVALHCGQMVQACARSSGLAALLLEAGGDLVLLDLVGSESFEVSSDAFASLHALLFTQAPVVASHLAGQGSFDGFFEAFNGLLLGGDYVRQRQALGLLGEIMATPVFGGVTRRYLSSECFLRIHMNLLRDTSKPIQAGALRVVKLFLANPDMPTGVRQTLCRNRSRLTNLLRALAQLRREDELFLQEARAFLDSLEALAPAAAPKAMEESFMRSVVEARMRDALAAVQ